jgi:hypothetical protein
LKERYINRSNFKSEKDKMKKIFCTLALMGLIFVSCLLDKAEKVKETKVVAAYLAHNSDVEPDLNWVTQINYAFGLVDTSTFDRIVILNEGKIAFCGTAAELSEKIGKKYFIQIKTIKGTQTIETDNIETSLIQILTEIKSKGQKVLDIKVDSGTLEQHFMEMAKKR